MAKIGTIERESFENWVNRMAENNGGALNHCEIRHVRYENSGTTYLVITAMDKETWFPLGPGEICNVGCKKYKEEKNNEQN